MLIYQNPWLPTGTRVATRTMASELIGRTFQATNQAITRLVDAGVLAQVNVGRRNRAFELHGLPCFRLLIRRFRVRIPRGALAKDQVRAGTTAIATCLTCAPSLCFPVTLYRYTKSR
jgi:hypothetical protein